MNSLIIKVLGLSVPRHVLFDRVRRMWKPQQPLKVIPLNNEYYIVSFSNKEDREYAYAEGPWMIDDHYLLVQRWRPNFNPWKADRQRKIAVWVRIPDLPMEFCTVESLEMIGNMIGKIIKIDRATSIYDKGAFARLCVEIDLQAPLLPAFTVFGEEKQLVYEGLHLVCFGCGMYGHERALCPDRAAHDDGTEERNNLDDGTGWMGPSTVDGDHAHSKQSMTDGGRIDKGTIDSATEQAKQSVDVKDNGFDVEHRTVVHLESDLAVSDSKVEKQGMKGRGRKMVRAGKPVHDQNTTTGVTAPQEHTNCASQIQSGGGRSLVSDRRKFLGPQMLLRRDFRRSSNGMDGIGGVKGGIGVKSGILHDTIGLDLQEAKMGDARGFNGAGNKEHLIATNLKKSKLNIKEVEEPKSEWKVVGSKRKKEERPKVFRKENKVNGRPKLKTKVVDDIGVQILEITNQYNPLPLDDVKASSSMGVLQTDQLSLTHDKGNGEVSPERLLDAEMGLGTHESDSGLAMSDDFVMGSDMAPTTLSQS
ncbi:hypothetical protein K1719_029011 [Acacia pycnantha]|nr:hypothetical protein K1719_029011 [Acacia pycnantha]